jgi:hypothetical protein
MKGERFYPTTFISEVQRHIDTARGLHSAACELLARRWGTPPPDNVQGRAAGGTILEPLAVELALKERQQRASPTIIKTHEHDLLFASLPEPEKNALRGSYKSARSGAFSSTLDEALARSSKLFEVWRYAHESCDPVRADIEEILCVFEVVQAGL